MKLSCMIGNSDGTLGRVIWYQQTVGKSPRYLLAYNTDSDKHQASDVPDRFSASKDSSRRNCYLTITNMQAEDEGDYYCLAFTSGGAVYTVIHSNEEVRQKLVSFLCCLPKIPLQALKVTFLAVTV